MSTAAARVSRLTAVDVLNLVVGLPPEHAQTTTHPGMLADLKVFSENLTTWPCADGPYANALRVEGIVHAFKDNVKMQDSYMNAHRHDEGNAWIAQHLPDLDTALTRLQPVGLALAAFEERRASQATVLAAMTANPAVVHNGPVPHVILRAAQRQKTWHKDVKDIDMPVVVTKEEGLRSDLPPNLCFVGTDLPKTPVPLTTVAALVEAQSPLILQKNEAGVPTVQISAAELAEGLRWLNQKEGVWTAHVSLPQADKSRGHVLIQDNGVLEQVETRESAARHFSRLVDLDPNVVSLKATPEQAHLHKVLWMPVEAVQDSRHWGEMSAAHRRQEQLAVEQNRDITRNARLAGVPVAPAPAPRRQLADAR